MAGDGHITAIIEYFFVISSHPFSTPLNFPLLPRNNTMRCISMRRHPSPPHAYPGAGDRASSVSIPPLNIGGIMLVVLVIILIILFLTRGCSC